MDLNDLIRNDKSSKLENASRAIESETPVESDFKNNDGSEEPDGFDPNKTNISASPHRAISESEVVPGGSSKASPPIATGMDLLDEDEPKRNASVTKPKHAALDSNSDSEISTKDSSKADITYDQAKKQFRDDLMLGLLFIFFAPIVIVALALLFRVPLFPMAVYFVVVNTIADILLIYLGYMKFRRVTKHMDLPAREIKKPNSDASKVEVKPRRALD